MKTKPYVIPKKLVMQAWKLVKASGGSGGVDGESLEDYESDLKNNLYKLWNRMSSGSYHPAPVRSVAIPKKTGGERILGIPTITDRVAQMVVKLQIEPEIEPHFLPDSYGYRAGKSALDAVGVTRERCWQYNWVLEFDIKGLFDNIPHDLLLKAVRKHVSCWWSLLYIERWLKAPQLALNGELIARAKGTPQGGVVSPLLSNLFLHYVFDLWMKVHYPKIAWCRYADDGLVHCRTQKQAKELLGVLDSRFRECGLELHPEKTKIVYCRDDNRRKQYEVTSFDFLGYTFCRRTARNSQGQLFFSFSPAVSGKALKSMRSLIKRSNLRNRVSQSLEEIADSFNAALRGWINYYGRFNPSALFPFLRYFNLTLRKWVMNKFRRYRGKKTQAGQYLEKLSKSCPTLFAHWRIGMTGVFA